MLTTLAQGLVVLCGLWLIAVGLLMGARPRTALRYLGKMASTNTINYTEITLRLIGGLALWQAAPISRFPEVFKLFGLFVVVSSLVLYFIPRRWHATYAVWWAERLPPPVVRGMAVFSLAFGGLLIYAVV